MSLRPACIATSAAALLGLSLIPQSAQAATAEACGGIELTDIGECHFEYSGGCKAKCEPLSFVAACDGECNASIDAQCTSSCYAACDQSCNLDPGAFECQAACEADCSASVAAQCGTDQDCQAYAEANCSAKCEADCSVVPPSASCDAQCNACCSGSCEVDANLDCSLECSAQMQGGCEVDCEAPEGALFCDGQYIAVADLPACMEYLAENFEIQFEAEAEASASASLTGCSLGERRATGVGGGMSALLLGFGVMLFGRRRRRS